MADHIQVGDVTPRVQYVANGSQTAFTFLFPIFAAADMEVWLDNAQQPDSAYTISGIGISGGGTVLFTIPPANGALVTLRRRLAIARTSDYQEDGIIRAKLLNDELDYQTAALQQVADDAGRAVKRSFLSANGADLTLPEPSAGRAIKWNATATGLENSAGDTDQILAGATAQATNAALSQSSAAASATDAAASATAAAASAGSAHVSELSALGSASTASSAANAAATSAANASASETAATAAAATAHGSDISAGTAASSAATQATSAATSATSAANSATTATTQAGLAAASAGTATTQAANAATSATAAAISAGSAQTYASQAQAAASGGAVKISATDTTGNFLQSKLLAGTNITLTKGNGGGNETLTVAVSGLGSAATLSSDTDTALAANSDSRVATQKAVKAYVDGKVAGLPSSTDVTALQQDVIQNYLLDAVNGAWAAGSFSNGGFDAFNTDTIGANSTGQTYESGKYYDNPPTAPSTSYANSLGTGDRTATIGVSKSGANWQSSGSNLPLLVNGNTGDAAQAITSGADCTGLILTFDLGTGAAKYFTEIKTYWQAGYATGGTFKWQGSNDNSTWSDMATWTWNGNGNGGGALATPVAANYGPWRYLRMLGVSGTCPSGVWLYEVEFKIGTSPGSTSNMTLLSSALSPAPASVPTQIKLMALYKDMSGSAVLNTDVTAEATPGLKPKRRDQWAADQFTVNRPGELRDPSMVAKGIGANITGSRAEIIICDDVEVPNTCDSAPKRVDLRERLAEIDYVMVPGGTQLYVGTPHSYYTIYAEQPRLETGETRPFLDGFARLELPLVDGEGHSAWPERFPSERIAAIRKRTGPNKFDSQMMLRPVNIADGRLDPDRMRLYEAELVYAEGNGVPLLTLGGRRLVSAACWWDPSYGSPGKGDSSVVAAVFTDEDGSYWLHRIRYVEHDPARTEVDEATQLCRQVATFVAELHLPAISLETNGLGRFLPGLLRRELAGSGVACAVVEAISKRAKDQRIVDAFDAVLAAGALHAHRSVWTTPFIGEMREWRPGGKGRDDGLDAVAGCLLSQPVRLSRAVVTAARPRWRPGGDSLVAETDFEF